MIHCLETLYTNLGNDDRFPYKSEKDSRMRLFSLFEIESG